MLTSCSYAHITGTVSLWNTRTIHDNKVVYTHQCMQIEAGNAKYADSVDMADCQQVRTSHIVTHPPLFQNGANESWFEMCFCTQHRCNNSRCWVTSTSRIQIL